MVTHVIVLPYTVALPYPLHTPWTQFKTVYFRGALAEFKVSIEVFQSENNEIIQMFDSWTENTCLFYFLNISQKVCSILTTV